jgi:hypothetical protein
VGNVEERHRLPTSHKLKQYYRSTASTTRAHPPRLLSKPNDGEQVEPAPVKPANDQMREARESDWELARE